MILRELILKVHPKLVDHLVNQAMTSTPGARTRRPRREEDRTTAPAAAAATTEPAGRRVIAGPGPADTESGRASTFRIRRLSAASGMW